MARALRRSNRNFSDSDDSNDMPPLKRGDQAVRSSGENLPSGRRPSFNNFGNSDEPGVRKFHRSSFNRSKQSDDDDDLGVIRRPTRGGAVDKRNDTADSRESWNLQDDKDGAPTIRTKITVKKTVGSQFAPQFVPKDVSRRSYEEKLDDNAWSSGENKASSKPKWSDETVLTGKENSPNEDSGWNNAKPLHSWSMPKNKIIDDLDDVESEVVAMVDKPVDSFCVDEANNLNDSDIKESFANYLEEAKKSGVSPRRSGKYSDSDDNKNLAIKPRVLMPSQAAAGIILAPKSFVLTAHAHGTRTDHVQCIIERDRSSISSKLYPAYTLCLEDNKKPLIYAKKNEHE